MIKQSTGEDWENANISLSTAQPDIGGSAPQLGIHHIGFVRPRALAVKSRKMKSFPLRDYNFISMLDEDDDEELHCLEFSIPQERFRAITSSSAKRSSRRRSYSPPPLEVEVAEVKLMDIKINEEKSSLFATMLIRFTCHVT